MARTTLVKLGPTVTARIRASRITGNDMRGVGHAHEDGVDAAAVVAGHEADRGAEGAGQQDGHHAGGQRHARRRTRCATSMSRPSRSVPSGCAQLPRSSHTGGLKRLRSDCS